MPEVILLLHNIRSTHNVGSIFRTAEGFGVSKIILSGYSPYPLSKNDTRLPHIAKKLSSQIHKTALGAEALVDFEYYTKPPIEMIKNMGYQVVGLEQAQGSIKLNQYLPSPKLCLVVGEEVSGISDSLLIACDDIVEIPMQGKKESFNVSVALGIALYGIFYH